jgi:hypothetical protein
VNDPSTRSGEGNNRRGRDRSKPRPHILSVALRARFYEETNVLGAENSEVLPVGLVAVAVTVRPDPTF